MRAAALELVGEWQRLPPTGLSVEPSAPEWIGLAETLPPVLGLGLEYRLGSQGTIKGFGVCIDRDSVESVPPACVDAAFLEFDGEPGGRFCTKPLIFHRFGSGIPWSAAEDAIGQLLGAARPSAASAAVRKIHAHLPSTTRYTDFAFLDARAPGWARVGLLMEMGAVRDLFAICPWSPADWQALQILLAEVATEQDWVRVQVDLGDASVPSGVELHAGQGPRDGNTWASLFGRLERYQLCTPGQARGLMQWPSLQARRLPSVGWCALERALSHVKLSRADSGGLQAKAYACLTPMEMLAP